jgi:hypothetical protein
MTDSNSQEGPKLSRKGTERLFNDFEIHCGNGTYRDVNKKQLEVFLFYFISLFFLK